jgi:hypothetical protein
LQASFNVRGTRTIVGAELLVTPASLFCIAVHLVSMTGTKISSNEARHPVCCSLNDEAVHRHGGCSF